MFSHNDDEEVIEGPEAKEIFDGEPDFYQAEALTPAEKLVAKEISEESTFQYYVNESSLFCKCLGRGLILLVPQLIGGIIVLPIALLFIKKEQKKLPWFIRWFDNADQYVGRDTSTFYKVCDQGNWERYKWLAWRNPLNYLGYQLGFVWTGSEKYIRFDPKTAQVGNLTGCIPGYKKTDIIRTNPKTNKVERFSERRWIRVYKNHPDKCIELYYGYKIGNPNTNKMGDHVQIVNRFSFWKSYNGAVPVNSTKEKNSPSLKMS